MSAYERINCPRCKSVVLALREGVPLLPIMTVLPGPDHGFYCTEWRATQWYQPERETESR